MGVGWRHATTATACGALVSASCASPKEAESGVGVSGARDETTAASRCERWMHAKEPVSAASRAMMRPALRVASSESDVDKAAGSSSANQAASGEPGGKPSKAAYRWENASTGAPQPP